jgi:hypothetical protein
MPHRQDRVRAVACRWVSENERFVLFVRSTWDGQRTAPLKRLGKITPWRRIQRY